MPAVPMSPQKSKEVADLALSVGHHSASEVAIPPSVEFNDVSCQEREAEVCVDKTDCEPDIKPSRFADVKRQQEL